MTGQDSDADQFTLFGIEEDHDLEAAAAPQPEPVTFPAEEAAPAATEASEPEVAEDTGVEEVGEETAQEPRPWESLPVTNDADGHASSSPPKPPTARPVLD